jgi:L-cysteine/cystine lyase
MEIAEIRNLIEATREVAYFNTGWTGPSPEPVVARMREVFDRECVAGPASLENLRLSRAENDSTRSAVAELFHADPDEVMITHGTTEGVHIALFGYPWQPGDELVTCSLEHPALAQSANVLEDKFGVVARRVEVPPSASEEEQVRLIGEAIGPRTKFVALSHIQYSCGLRMPIGPIAEIAHRAGALVLIDGAQTGGAIDIDARGIGADFYAISGQKWVLGPQGTGAFYAASEHIREINPLFNSHALADKRAEMSENAGPPNLLQRFRVTSQSTALVAGFGEAIRILQSIGWNTVEERGIDLAGRMRSGFAAIPGCTMTGPLEGGTTSALVSVAVENWAPSQVVEALWDRWRIAARAVNSPPAVRFSNHVFNTENEVDQVLNAVEALAKETPPVAVASH